MQERIFDVYTVKSTGKLLEEHEIHNMMIHGDQVFRQSESFTTTSYSFHSCVGALSYIYGPVKEASDHHPHLTPPHTFQVLGVKMQKSANPVCPRLPGMSHI